MERNLEFVFAFDSVCVWGGVTNLEFAFAFDSVCVWGLQTLSLPLYLIVCVWGL